MFLHLPALHTVSTGHSLDPCKVSDPQFRDFSVQLPGVTRAPKKKNLFRCQWHRTFDIDTAGFATRRACSQGGIGDHQHREKCSAGGGRGIKRDLSQLGGWGEGCDCPTGLDGSRSRSRTRMDTTSRTYTKKSWHSVSAISILLIIKDVIKSMSQSTIHYWIQV